METNQNFRGLLRLLAALLVAPRALFAPIAGWLGGRFPGKLVVIGMPGGRKDEELVLLATFEVTSLELNRHMASQGMPEPGIPGKMRKVDRVPLLGSGKPDLAACRQLALEESL